MNRRKVGRPRPDEAADLTKLIANTALRMFLADGFAATTIDAIVAKLHISKATFYARFPSKAALLDAAMAAMGVNKVPPPLNPAQMSLLFPARLRLWADILLVAFLQPEAIALERLTMAESYRFPQLAEATHVNGLLKIVALLRDFFDDAIARGDLKPVDTTLLAEHYTDVLLGFIRRAAHGISSPHPDTAAQERLWAATQIIFTGLLPDGRSL